jgi:hypothetical protein
MKILGLLTLLLFIACGEKSSNDSSHIYKVPKGTKLNIQVKEASIDSYTPSGVGTLYGITNGDQYSNLIQACTWFLISDKHAMTNSHCVPEELKSDEKVNCGDYIQGRIMTNSGRDEIRSCAKLLHFSDIKESNVLFQNDYAIIELDKPLKNTNVFKVSREGFTDGDKISVLTMNHNRYYNIYSEYLKHDCVVKSSDMLGKINHPGSSPLTGFRSEGSDDFCKVIGGNSGSPVLNEQGEVAAIVHGGLGEGKSFSNLSSFASNEMSVNIGVFTNLRCLDLKVLELDPTITETCQPTENEEAAEKLMADLEKKMEGIIVKMQSELPTYLMYDYKVKNLGLDSMVFYSPKCIRSMDEWTDIDKTLVNEKGLLFKTLSKDTEIPSYKVQTTYNLDYYGNMYFDVRHRVIEKMYYTFEKINRLDSKKQVRFSVSGLKDGKYLTNDARLPLCSESDKNWTKKETL